MAFFSEIKRAVRRILHFWGRPVRSAAGEGETVIQAYRGFGSPREVYLEGRVYRQSRAESNGSPLRRDLKDLWRRLMRTGQADVPVTARFYGAEQVFVTDETGFFRVRLPPAETPPRGRLWHDLELEVKPDDSGEPGVVTRSEVFLPHADCRYIVISDIDDTIMATGVANKLLMIRNLFFRSAQSRVAFPGAASFYRALHKGHSGTEDNPMLYLSRAPWSIYEMLDEFFHLHRIPVGPVLFLRDWGMSPRRPFPRKAKGHKLFLLRHILTVYGNLPFILVGDSGQHDPEIYAAIVRENPGRILAVYIRNVSRKNGRVREIQELAEKVAGAGSSLLLAADTAAMAEHAHQNGWISGEDLQEVRKERVVLGGEVKPVRKVSGESAAKTGREVESGAVSGELREGDSRGSPPNVVVEPQNRKEKGKGAG